MFMRFSLILATIETGEEIIQFIESLSRQSYKDLELIIVDQNDDQRIDKFLSNLQLSFPVTQLSSPPGLSRARNVGIDYAKGDIIAFPDDDCIYPDSLLEDVEACFVNDHHLGGVTGKVVDFEGNEYARFSKTGGKINLVNVWQRASSISLFIKSDVIRLVGGFDETLGLGAGTPWGGGEDIDYPLRVVKAGYEVFYDPAIKILHPNPVAQGYLRIGKRSFQYGAGIGRVWRKHRFPLWLVGFYLLRPLGGSIISLLMLNWPKSRYHWNAFRGRLYGYLARV